MCYKNNMASDLTSRYKIIMCFLIFNNLLLSGGLVLILILVKEQLFVWPLFVLLSLLILFNAFEIHCILKKYLAIIKEQNDSEKKDGIKKETITLINNQIKDK